MSCADCEPLVDFVRDVPTTVEDLRVLRALAAPAARNLLPELARLTAATRCLGLTPPRSTAAGRPPFELDRD